MNENLYDCTIYYMVDCLLLDLCDAMGLRQHKQKIA